MCSTIRHPQSPSAGLILILLSLSNLQSGANAALMESTRTHSQRIMKLLARGIAKRVFCLRVLLPIALVLHGSRAPGQQAPTILTPPADQTVTPGQTAVFAVLADGTPTPNFQWQEQTSGTTNWYNLADDANYSGSSASSLVVSNTTPDLNGSFFQCIVTNASGSVTSPPATLRVLSFDVTTFAGLSGSPGQNDGVGQSARFNAPHGIAADSSNNLYVADTYNSTIRKITPDGQVATLAGQPGSPGNADGAGGQFYLPYGVAVDSAGTLYVTDSGNNTVRKITPAGVVSTLAGLAGNPGSANGTNSAARFFFPKGIAVDALGNVFVTDQANQTIRQITPAGVVSTLAGLAGNWGSADGTNDSARFSSPSGLALDTFGNLLVADTGNHTIRQVTPAGIVTTVAGLAENAGSADGTNRDARFFYPEGVAMDASANVFVADTWNNTIREITQGRVFTLAGLAGTSGTNDGTASAARFSSPTGLAAAPGGAIYVSDTSNSSIRQSVFSSPPLLARTIGLLGNLAFGAVQAGQTASQILTITNSGGSALTVAGINCPSGFSGSWSGIIPAGSSVQATITFSPTLATNYSGTLTVTSDATGGVGAIAISGIGTAVPTRVLGLAGNLAFGMVPIGQNPTAALTLTNSGNSTLTVSNISYPPGFSGAWNGSIGAGDSQVVGVTFAPIAPVSYGGNLIVGSDATDGTASLAISGTGFVAGSGLQLTGMSWSNGVSSFTLNGSAGSNYVIQISSDLISWAPFSTNTIPAAGLLSIVDPSANMSVRFYRAVPQAVANNGIYLPAASGLITAPFIISNNFIYQPLETELTNAGSALYSFTISNAGNYVIQATVNAPNEGANSFFVNIDAEPQDPYMVWDIPLTSGFESRVVSWRGNGTFEYSEFVPEVFNLTPGPHQLIIRGREAVTLLQDLLIISYP